MDARFAYQRLLSLGLDASDRELARRGDYRRFLTAGLQILRQGGPLAVSSARATIVASVPGADARHFDRLWDGLLPDRA